MGNKIQIKYDELDDITRKVSKSVTKVEELLTKARLCITMMDDGVWIGRGADKYRAEMESRAVPGLRKLLAALSDMHYGFLRAGDMFREAEQEAAQQIERMPVIPLPTGVLVGGGGGSIGGNQDFSFGFGNPSPINNPGGIGGNPDFVFPPNTGLGDQTDLTNPNFNPFPGNSGGIGGNPNITIPDIFPIDNGQTVPRPDWYTEYSEDIDGFNGAVNGAILLIDGGSSPTGHMGNIVSESAAAGGVPVSGMLVNNVSDTRQAERAASAVGGFLANNPNAQIKLSPGLQALINGVETDSLGRSLMNMPTQEQIDAMRIFVGILRTTVEAFGRALPEF